jgi:hypothetical protein
LELGELHRSSINLLSSASLVNIISASRLLRSLSFSASASISASDGWWADEGDRGDDMVVTRDSTRWTKLARTELVGEGDLHARGSTSSDESSVVGTIPVDVSGI